MSSREKILLCASEMFYHVGYQATSVDDIVQQSNVAKSNFYYHFKSKEELVFAVMELQVAEYEQMAEQTLKNLALSPAERLRSFFVEVCRAQSGERRMAGCPLGNFAATLPNTEDERTQRFRKRLLEFFHSLEGMMETCLIAGMERGDFRNDLAPEALSELLLATMQGLLTLTKTQKDTHILEQGTFLVQELLKVP